MINGDSLLGWRQPKNLWSISSKILQYPASKKITKKVARLTLMTIGSRSKTAISHLFI